MKNILTFYRCLIYYVHDFRVRHKRAVFDLIELVWKKIKDRKNNQPEKSTPGDVHDKHQVELKETI